MANAKNAVEMYVEEITPVNEIKGFTKSFVKRTKDKKTEDVDVKELLNYTKLGKVRIGAKIAEKGLKKGLIEKIYVSSNCKEETLSKLNHYAKIENINLVELNLDNNELSQKMGKPFLVSVVSIVGGSKE